MDDGLESELSMIDQDPEERSGSTGPRTSVFRKDPEGPSGQEQKKSDEPLHRQDEGSAAQRLGNVAAVLEEESRAPEPDVTKPDGDESYVPKQPSTLAEVGLSKAFLTDLALKIMHYSGTPTAAQLMRRMGLGQNMVQQILSSLQEERLCEVLSQSDLFTGNYRYRLSERGTARASEALERSRYAGPVPVTAEQYAEVIRAQRVHREMPRPDHIKSILGDYVMAPDVADAVARALYSGKTTLFHGASGNGKTSILERYASRLDGGILVPYALYVYGQVIRVFDPSIHEPLEESNERNATKDDSKRDRRWLLIRRPAVVLGSELGKESLDLAYDPQSRFYQAPPHVKAQGGVLVVDDLGRQKTEARDLMTRWLISVERGWDSLSLVTGEKLTVPFDVQLLFATNRPIHDLADEALLRRILYKVEMPSPGPEEFAEILRRLCHERGVKTPEGAMEWVIQQLYGQSDEPPRAAYARDLVEVIVESASYDGRDPVLDKDSFQRAYRLFMSQRGASPA